MGWNKERRRKLLEMARSGLPWSEIRVRMGGGGRPMSQMEYHRQLALALRESRRRRYVVTRNGRLVIPDFLEVTGFPPGARFVVKPPRKGSRAWLIEPVEGG